MRAMVLFTALAFAVVITACGSGGSATTRAQAPPKPLAVYAAGKRIEIVRPGQRRIRVPDRAEARRGRASLDLAVPTRRARRSIRRALAAHEARVDLPVVPVRTTISLRPVRQVLHNDCESTALSMLLAAAGIHAGQLQLQERLPRSGPLDPEAVANSSLFRWGDPERGFVGRPAGGGTEGGFGVYEPPIRALAARYGVRLLDLHGRTLGAIREAVLAGHPVPRVGGSRGRALPQLADAVGTQDHGQPQRACRDARGRRAGYFLVNNPLTGRRERWSDELFSYRWKLLGRRALELPQY